MRAARIIVAAIAILAVVAPAAPAQARWRGLSDLFYDDGGKVCENAMDFSMANLGDFDPSVTVINTTPEPDIVVTPTTTLDLVFAPVPELFAVFSDFHLFSGSFRLSFSPKPESGDLLMLDFGPDTDMPTEVVRDCTLRKRFAGFFGLGNPPTVNVPSDPSSIRVVFSLQGNRGANIFSEPPSFAAISCSPSDPPPTPTPTVAVGTLRYRADTDRYIYRWRPPPGLSGCQELWFRTKWDGLTHRVMFDFGTPSP